MAAFEEASLAPRGVAKGLTVSAFRPLLMGGVGFCIMGPLGLLWAFWAGMAL